MARIGSGSFFGAPRIPHRTKSGTATDFRRSARACAHLQFRAARALHSGRLSGTRPPQGASNVLGQWRPCSQNHSPNSPQNSSGGDAVRQAHRAAWLAVGLALFIGVAVPTAAVAGPYTRLQVLLPGETAAPGTGSG